ncbi:MAG: thioredoxin family protein [Pseudomonadota bacterium]
MALTPSRMVELGSPAPAFSLPATDGQTLSLDDFSAARVLVVAFICNHCPYVKHLKPGLVEFVHHYRDQPVAFVAINSNDATSYPEDGFEAMVRDAEAHGYNFPYLYDESQAAARAYGAECTPDFFLYGPERELLYRGQFDESRPNNGSMVTGRDLRAAVDAVLAGRRVREPQIASIGCNIKWREAAA